MFEGKILRDRVAIITGGGTGLGRAFALRFSELGAKVALASRSPEHLEPTRAEIVRHGATAIAIPTDVRVPEQVDAMVERVVKELGRVDILVNNAAGNFICKAEKLSPNGWRAVVDIVLNGSFFCSRAVGQKMITQKYGRILNIVTTYWATGNPGTIHSAAAKAGVVAMTKTLAAEWGRYNIRVNAIAPGPFPTEGAASRLFVTQADVERMLKGIPAGRLGEPRELANLAAFLVSDYADYINGEVVTMDGGASVNSPMFDWERF